jgi:hypothetical protein
MGRQVAPLERGGGSPLSQVSSPINRSSFLTSNEQMTTSPKDECYPLKKRPLLDEEEKQRSSEALPKFVLELDES